MLEILKTDGTPATDLPITGFEAGQDTDVLTLDAWQDRDNPLGQDEYGVLLVIQTEDPTTPGTFLSSGVPPQDELWWQMRVIGNLNADRPDQQPFLTAWQPVGAYAGLLLPNLLAGGGRRIEIKGRPPSNAVSRIWRIAVSAIVSEASRPVPPALTYCRRGVLTGVGDTARSGIVLGCEPAASSPADDEVHVGAGLYLAAGELRGKVETSHVLNQTDGAAAALTAGKAYMVAVSLGPSGATLTKGAQAVAPVKPAAPAGDELVGYWRVDYQAGGTSVIEAADLSGGPLYDRYLARAGVGLELLLGKGQALGAGTWRYSTREVELPLTASVTNYVWQLPSGLPEVTTTATPPAGALPLWEADTDVAGVVALRDRRTYCDEAIIIHLRGDLPGSPGEIASQLVALERLQVEAIWYRLSDAGGTSGQTKLDLLVEGATAYTSSATDDQRPAWAHDASVLTDDDGFHEVTLLRRGDVVALHSVEHPAGGTPAWAEAYVICRAG